MKSEGNRTKKTGQNARLAALVCALAFLLSLVPGTGSAVTAVDLSKYRSLGDITKLMNFTALRPLMDRGEVCQISYRKDGRFDHFSIFSLVNAPPDKVAYVLNHPGEYPDFVKNVRKSKVVEISRDGRTFDVDYEIEIPLINMKGTNHQTMIPNGMEIWGTDGSMKGGHWVWRFIPADGGDKTIISYTGYLDPRSASLVLRKLVKSNPTLEAGTNLAGGMVLVRAVKYRATKLAGRPLPAKRAPSKAASLHSVLAGSEKVDYRALIPMLAHGQMSLIESGPDGSLVQGSMMTLMEKPVADVFAVVDHPELFHEFVPNISKVLLTKEEGGFKYLDWTVDTPIASVKFSNKYRGWAPKRAHLVATGGDLKVGAWGWELREISATRSFAVYYNYADLRSAGFAIRKMIDVDPSFEHGLNVANGLTMVLAVKSRVEGRSAILK